MSREDTSIGSLSYAGNEERNYSKVDDPPKYRMGSPGPGRSLGALSGNRIHPDGSGEQEMTLQQMKQDGRAEGTTSTAGEHVFHVDNGIGGDAGMVEVLTLRHDEIRAFGRLVATRDGGSIPSGGGSFFYSPNGRFRTQFQDDGNVVTYDTFVQPWKAIWSTLTGWLGV